MVEFNRGCIDGRTECRIIATEREDLSWQLDGRPCVRQSDGYQCGETLLPFVYYPGIQSKPLTFFQNNQPTTSSAAVALRLPAQAAEWCVWRPEVLAQAWQAAVVTPDRPAPGADEYFSLLALRAEPLSLYQSKRVVQAMAAAGDVRGVAAHVQIFADPLDQANVMTALATNTRDPLVQARAAQSMRAVPHVGQRIVGLLRLAAATQHAGVRDEGMRLMRDAVRAADYATLSIALPGLFEAQNRADAVRLIGQIPDWSYQFDFLMRLAQTSGEATYAEQAVAILEKVPRTHWADAVKLLISETLQSTIPGSRPIPVAAGGAPQLEPLLLWAAEHFARDNLQLSEYLLYATTFWHCPAAGIRALERLDRMMPQITALDWRLHVRIRIALNIQDTARQRAVVRDALQLLRREPQYARSRQMPWGWMLLAIERHRWVNEATALAKRTYMDRTVQAEARAVAARVTANPSSASERDNTSVVTASSPVPETIRLEPHRALAQAWATPDPAVRTDMLLTMIAAVNQHCTP